MFVKKHVRLFDGRCLDELENQINVFVDDCNAEVVDQSLSVSIDRLGFQYVMSVTFIFHDNVD